MIEDNTLVPVAVWYATVDIPKDEFDDPACWWWEEPDSHPASWSSNGQREFLREWHDGRCGICDKVKVLVLDHDHRTGLARGYLCIGCNTAEGIAKGPRDIYARWRARPATEVLALRFAYQPGKNPAAPNLDHQGGPLFNHSFSYSSWPHAPYQKRAEWGAKIVTFVAVVAPATVPLVEAENAYRRACHDLDLASKAVRKRPSVQSAERYLQCTAELQQAAERMEGLGLERPDSRDVTLRRPLEPGNPLEYLPRREPIRRAV